MKETAATSTRKRKGTPAQVRKKLKKDVQEKLRGKFKEVQKGKQVKKVKQAQAAQKTQKTHKAKQALKVKQTPKITASVPIQLASALDAALFKRLIDEGDCSPNTLRGERDVVCFYRRHQENLLPAKAQQKQPYICFLRLSFRKDSPALEELLKIPS